MKSISEIRFEAIPLGFDDGQAKLTDDNIGRILTFSGVPLALLRCCVGEGNKTAVLYEDGQIFIIPVETGYFLDCIGEYLDTNMSKRRKTTVGMVNKKSNNAVYLGAGLQYIPIKVDVPWVDAKKFSYVNWNAVYERHDRKAKNLAALSGLVIPYRQRADKVQEKLDEGKRIRELFIQRYRPVLGEWLYCKECRAHPVCLERHDRKKSVDNCSEAHKFMLDEKSDIFST